MNLKVPGYLRTRIGRRFLIVFLIVSLVPLSVMRWLAIRKSQRAIQEQTRAVLRAASDGAEAELREFLQNLRDNLIQVSEDGAIQEAVRNIATNKDSDSLPSLRKNLNWRIPRDAQELFILDDAGHVLASTSPLNQGRNYSTNRFFLQGSKAFDAGDVHVDTDGKFTWIMAAPIASLPERHVIGVAAFRIEPAVLNALTSGRRVLSNGADTQSFRIGDTGETYIVNQEGYMITESRFQSNAVLRLKVDTLPVRVGLDQGQEITEEYIDYRGTQVSGGSVVFRNPHWILITEIDFRQAFAPIIKMQNQLIFAAIALILLAALFAWSFTWKVLNPIGLLSESDRALAAQDETGALVPETGLPNDEIGQLVRQRNARIKSVFDYQRQLESRTAKLQEMINELEHISYAIVHDMRAPLRAMRGFAELLENENEQLSPEERKLFLKNISEAALRLDYLIRDVLTYNRTVLRRTSLHPVDLDSLLRGILDSYPNFNSGKATFEIEGTLPTVIGNEALLTQCFSNLLDNSLKFVLPETRPHVRIWAEPLPAGESPPPELSINRADSHKNHLTAEAFTRIWIEDNGIGIPEDVKPRLFRMFQRFTHDQNGTGIGLAIVHKVVEQMGGTIGLFSEPGKGTRFWVVLQRASETAQPSTPVESN